MKKNKWNIFLVVSLTFVSILIYFLQIQIFGKSGDTFFYLLQDLAFLPLQVLLVTLIISELLKKREKKSLMNKMNMTVGVYFSEMGNELIGQLLKLDRQVLKIQGLFSYRTEWNDAFFSELEKTIGTDSNRIEIDKKALVPLKNFLLSKRSFLINLLGNTNLLEHQSFTDSLWAVSHLTEELWLRDDLSSLTKNDSLHLANDMNRAYVRTLNEWVFYLHHLRDDYPYIFSLYVRSNPFDPQAKIEFE